MRPWYFPEQGRRWSTGVAQGSGYAADTRNVAAEEMVAFYELFAADFDLPPDFSGGVCRGVINTLRPADDGKFKIGEDGQVDTTIQWIRQCVSRLVAGDHADVTDGQVAVCRTAAF